MTQFPDLKNDLLLRAARGEKTERAPVWVMRQAGRYLPEFRAVRAHHEFFEICRTPELACEITVQPVRRYSGVLDAAIIFSDILVIPQAMGMEVIMNPGPSFPAPLDTPEDALKLPQTVDVEKELKYVFDALTRTRHELKGEVPLIGFCGAPWTLFAYMVEGGGSKTLQKSKTWLFKYPEESKALLKRIADVCVDYLVGQVKAGAQKLAAAQIPAPPMTLFAKGANYALGSLAESAGYDVLGLDWAIEPSEARKLVGGKVALQGNMDPSLLYGGRDAIEAAVKRMCESFGTGGGWIANLGHGITPAVDPEDLRWFFECVHKYSTVA
ncbi:hypothetical protein BD626DRAFT_116691 [Schizophyllum amplum]|uniref:Uroporphyrinogen decarboxylase n=1 Tax=Schizophyllum amplum TaxID=97359 RepID=A0A550CUK7_9AGAR|nr:hypothetical protein BD626DRAFT_116691 [Auriculariopsis ampla]